MQMLEFKHCKFERIIALDQILFITGDSSVIILDSKIKDVIGIANYAFFKYSMSSSGLISIIRCVFEDNLS